VPSSCRRQLLHGLFASGGRMLSLAASALIVVPKLVAPRAFARLSAPMEPAQQPELDRWRAADRQRGRCAYACRHNARSRACCRATTAPRAGPLAAFPDAHAVGGAVARVHQCRPLAGQAVAVLVIVVVACVPGRCLALMPAGRFGCGKRGGCAHSSRGGVGKLWSRAAINQRACTVTSEAVECASSQPCTPLLAMELTVGPTPVHARTG